MSFQDDLRRFGVTINGRTQDLFVGVVQEATRSMVEGSEVTGAPGQPVDTGNLRASYHTSYPSPMVALITTNVEYAPYIEDGVNRWGPVAYRNHGPHSRKLTIAGMPAIVAYVARQLAQTQ